MIIDRILSNGFHQGGHTAVKAPDMTITYQGLCSSVQAMAGRLEAGGLEQGGKALVLLPNSPEFVVAFLALAYAGCTAVLADTKYNDELRVIFDENDIRWVFTNAEGLSKIERLLGQGGTPDGGSIGRPDILLSEEIRGLIKGALSGESGLHAYRREVRPEDTAMILYTSGSVGQPKGVINSHRTLENALCNYLGTLPVGPWDKWVGVTPFFHSYAFGSCMLAGLASGGTLLLEESFKPRVLLKRIEQEKATIFQGVPYMYSLLNEHYSPGEHCIDSLRFCISAGAPLSPETSRIFYKKTGKVIHQEYGSSETGTIAINLSEDPELNIASVGRPLHNVEVRIAAGENDGLGLIEVKSPGHSIGYIGRDRFDRGWYSTGDLGKIDPAGNIYILGREKRLINISGLKVNPAEVETYLLKHPGIADVLVRGSAHPEFGEIVEALVVRRSDSVLAEDIIGFCRQHLALYKVPRVITWVDELPRSGTGKIKY